MQITTTISGANKSFVIFLTAALSGLMDLKLNLGLNWGR